jgi:hypothetical protein
MNEDIGAASDQQKKVPIKLKDSHKPLHLDVRLNLLYQS